MTSEMGKGSIRSSVKRTMVTRKLAPGTLPLRLRVSELPFTALRCFLHHREEPKPARIRAEIQPDHMGQSEPIQHGWLEPGRRIAMLRFIGRKSRRAAV